MHEHAPIFNAFAALLRYPEHGPEACVTAVENARAAAKAAGTGSATFFQRLEGLREFFATQTLKDLEERYTQTFDINPAVTLDAGFHLFGLSYKRGTFLVKLQESLREAGLDKGTELADHLPVLLELAAALPAPEASEFIAECVAFPVRRMTAGFPPGEAGYASVIATLNDYLKDNFGCVEITQGEDDKCLDQSW